MNRRDLTRWGLIGGWIAAGGSSIFANEQPPAWSDALSEPLPDHLPIEPTSLREAVASGQISAVWSIVEPLRARLSLKNNAKEPIAIRMDSGTILSDGRSRWLAGSPSRFEGAFSGQLFYDSNIPGLRSVAIPTLPGRTASLVLPIVTLNSREEDPFPKSTDIKVESVTDWTKDSAIRAAIDGLSSLGTSLPVAQGIVWRVVEGKSWKELSGRTIQGRVLNEFEKNSIDHYLAVVAKSGSATPEELYRKLMSSKFAVKVDARPKYKSFVKPVSDALVGSEFMGSPIESVETSPRSGATDSLLSLEVVVVEVDSVAPVRLTVEASLSTRFGEPTRPLRWAKTRCRIALPPDSESVEATSDLPAMLASRFAEQVIRLERLNAGPMYSKYRIENLTPLTVSSVSIRVDDRSTDPAVWTIDGLGISPRGRCLVPIPADRAKAVDIRWSPI